MATNLEQVAQQLGYPSHLFGFTPNERAYWTEPGMPWVLPLLNPAHFGLDPVTCEQELAGLMAFRPWNDNMAPRFADGCLVAGKPLAWGAPVQVGQLLAWVGPGEALDCFELARVVAVGAGELWLACDHSPARHCLPWGVGLPDYPVYRITHYVTQPSGL